MSKITIEKSDGVKCPRCWRYWGIPELPQGICDRCASDLLSAESEDFHVNVKPEDIPQFDVSFRALQEEIKAAFLTQANKYHI